MDKKNQTKQHSSIKSQHTFATVGRRVHAHIHFALVMTALVGLFLRITQQVSSNGTRVAGWSTHTASPAPFWPWVASVVSQKSLGLGKNSPWRHQPQRRTCQTRVQRCCRQVAVSRKHEREWGTSGDLFQAHQSAPKCQWAKEETVNVRMSKSIWTQQIFLVNSLCVCVCVCV